MVLKYVHPIADMDSTKESDIANVCTECHGFGLIKDDEHEKKEDNDFIGFLNHEEPDNPIL